MELGATDPVTGDKKMFFFYSLLAKSLQNLSWLHHNFKHGGKKKLEKYHVTIMYVSHLVWGFKSYNWELVDNPFKILPE